MKGKLYVHSLELFNPSHPPRRRGFMVAVLRKVVLKEASLLQVEAHLVVDELTSGGREEPCSLGLPVKLREDEVLHFLARRNTHPSGCISDTLADVHLLEGEEGYDRGDCVLLYQIRVLKGSYRYKKCVCVIISRESLSLTFSALIITMCLYADTL